MLQLIWTSGKLPPSDTNEPYCQRLPCVFDLKLQPQVWHMWRNIVAYAKERICVRVRQSKTLQPSDWQDPVNQPTSTVPSGSDRLKMFILSTYSTWVNSMCLREIHSSHDTTTIAIILLRCDASRSEYIENTADATPRYPLLRRHGSERLGLYVVAITTEITLYVVISVSTRLQGYTDSVWRSTSTIDQRHPVSVPMKFPRQRNPGITIQYLCIVHYGLFVGNGVEHKCG